ncbi:glutaminyl-peptide cyclotransferase [Streptomyces sp. NPDC003758]|uniref:Glutaminyl-peptide cyclotransferase n=1 Tax=Streptomyces cynarae TaxID=2981134 RepID=A0ABY6E518_9ACTN|nr:glutaminyl-peptide cyclotransferase [Streptomyces cynarae]UXY21008.1 glutaminyl-peptide cyclotransferase [Streptomyces cynarae]
MSEPLRSAAAVALAGALVLASSATRAPARGGAPDDAAGSWAVRGRQASAHRTERLRVKVIETVLHDPKAYTEGLEMADATLYEGTGLSGRSSVRAGPPGTPPTVYAALPATLFGEGITLVGRTLWQLTWRNRIAVERDAATLRELRRVPYPDEGWGICLDRGRRRLVTSDGSARLTFRDPRTLAKTGEVTVTENGRPVAGLNELECVGTAVYANVFPTDRLVRLDAATGAVTAGIDASGLLRADERVPGSVLNGIAAVPGTDQFLITGKFWPKMFRVTFAPAQPVRPTAR